MNYRFHVLFPFHFWPFTHSFRKFCAALQRKWLRRVKARKAPWVPRAFTALPPLLGHRRNYGVAAVIDVNCPREYASEMRAVEFTTELGKKPVVTIPQEVADKLPKSGRARIIVLTPDDPEDALWRAGAYEQFVREDSPEDAVYDSY
jgi:hypothetical protein